MFANIFIKKNRLPCAGCTKCQDSGNEVKYLVKFKNYSIIQGTVHTLKEFLRQLYFIELA